MSDKEVKQAVAVHVTEGDSHIPFGPAEAIEGDAASDGLILECSIFLIDPKMIGLGIVGDENIGPAVSVEVGADDAKTHRHPLADAGVDIATLATPIVDEVERTNPNVVKVVGTKCPSGHLRAMYFTRATAPWGEGPLFHHIGVYAYRRAALERFVALGPSPLETREKLEQLRALEAGMRIDVAIVDICPLGVDTPADLARARTILGTKQI